MRHPSAASWNMFQNMSRALRRLHIHGASFHGLTLPDEKVVDPPKIREAELVQSQSEDGRRMIKEMTRAEMSAHSIILQKDTVGPYERRLQQLNEAQSHHQIVDQVDQNVLAYAQSLLNIGELHYQLGHMDEAQEIFMSALKELLSSSSDDDNGDCGGNSKQMIAQSMNALGAIHARCGEFDEASRWYEESLKQMHKLLRDNMNGDSPSESITYYHDLAKSYNGLAILEVMKNEGDGVQWEKAISLFQEAEQNYLYGYDQKGQDDTTDGPKAAIRQMTPRHAESLINVRSNMAELLRQRGQHEAAVEMLRSALDMAREVLENVSEEADRKSGANSITPTPVAGPTLDEQQNTIVDLLVKTADILLSNDKFDEAAEAYEQALSSHVFFRRWNKDSGTSNRAVLPATITAASTSINLDITTATTLEAAIRKNLGQALAQIGKGDISLGHYEASLAITRKIGGDFHMEVAHTLMGMGALHGGPLRDVSRALICFKEALHIYRTNLEELSGANKSDEEAEEIERHVQSALKNINLIEAALLKDKESKQS